MADRNRLDVAGHLAGVWQVEGTETFYEFFADGRVERTQGSADTESASWVVEQAAPDQRTLTIHVSFGARGHYKRLVFDAEPESLSESVSVRPEGPYGQAERWVRRGD